jgi:hypothetical protein
MKLPALALLSLFPGLVPTAEAKKFAPAPVDRREKKKGWWNKQIPSMSHRIILPPAHVRTLPKSERMSFHNPRSHRPNAEPNAFAKQTNNQRVIALRAKRLHITPDQYQSRFPKGCSNSLYFEA